ncbi:MAG TPA: PTS sugar transporter subunit IIC [Desulfuromonadales bacterium]|nr:PTS sugar transporter subunit IIC [Desulfuromonadales bacterium]
MTATDFILAGLVAVGAGLDRVAFLQSMFSRPIVVAPLTGWLLGDPMVGLEIGILLELLWLGRLPVGASIPPDDTQVAIGATVLSLSMESLLGMSGMPVVILCVMAAIPLGKFGQVFDRLARHANGLVLKRNKAFSSGSPRKLERLHLACLLHFALAGLATFGVIVGGGTVLLYYLAPVLIGAVREAGLSLQYSFTLVGAAVLLGLINISRGVSLFSAAFAGTLLVLWVR